MTAQIIGTVGIGVDTDTLEQQAKLLSFRSGADGQTALRQHFGLRPDSLGSDRPMSNFSVSYFSQFPFFNAQQIPKDFYAQFSNQTRIKEFSFEPIEQRPLSIMEQIKEQGRLH